MGFFPELVFFVCERFNRILRAYADGVFAKLTRSASKDRISD